MKNLLILSLFVLGFAACKNEGTSGKDAGNTAGGTALVVPGVPMCYLMTEGQDSTWVRFVIESNDSLRGSYDWIPWQKDGARGALYGKRTGDNLHVMYDYTIEGSSQKEDKVFRMEEDKLMEGEGELEDRNGVLYLKDPANVKYTKTFTRGACK